MKKYALILTIFLCTLFSGYAQDRDTMDVCKHSTVEFVINTDEFIHNDNYNKFIFETVPFIINNSKDIENILLIGSASPEGHIERNIDLANHRADKIYSYISNYVSRDKVIINNDYGLFLSKTGLDESDYKKLRATYIEIQYRKVITSTTDTLRITKRDTVRFETVNNYYIENKTVESIHNKPIFAVYNDLLGDLLFRVNIGTELYFKQYSFFIEGSFSDWSLIGKTYNIDIWHIGIRDYFNDDYNKLFVELYGHTGYFDTDLFGDIGKIGVLYGGGLGIGYVFDLCPHWKLIPMFRLGLFEKVYYADYYYTESGNINVSFGNYSNGKVDNTENTNTGSNGEKAITVNKTITKEFFENSNKVSYIGPTYVGIILKRDFCRNKKDKRK